MALSIAKTADRPSAIGSRDPVNDAGVLPFGPCFVNSPSGLSGTFTGDLMAAWLSWQSTSFTSMGSQVRVLLRPPESRTERFGSFAYTKEWTQRTVPGVRGRRFFCCRSEDHCGIMIMSFDKSGFIEVQKRCQRLTRLLMVQKKCR